MLDIQDTNIIFEDDCVKEGRFKGNPCKYVVGRLTYSPTSCKNCGIKDENQDRIYKNGTQMSRITLPIGGLTRMYLCLKKQRFICKACDSSFTAQTPLVKKNCFISVHTNAQVVVKSAEAQSITSIARDCSVSTATVKRLITREAKTYKPHHKVLPKHLSFDEFKYAAGRMAFEYIDAETGNILDILDSRDSYTIKNHFIAHYTLKERHNVETITIDMNAGYVNVILEMFPRAKIIIDRFHLVQLISRSMNQSRINIMNTLRTSHGEDMKKYRRLKRYWKLLLKKESKLSHTEYKYYRLFGQRLEVNIVKEMLEYDERLKVNYILYQQLLRAMHDRNFKTLEKILANQPHHLSSKYMKTSLRTLRKHSPYIKNSFIYPYNNGRIEGVNNKIKVLNRVAYGYRSFINFKNRIILHFKLKPVVSKSNKTQKIKPSKVA